jgi:hypothetical protein
MLEAQENCNTAKKSSPTKFKKDKVNFDPVLNHLISEYIHFSEKNDSVKSLIDHLESTNRTLQRCQYKPESRKEIKDEKLFDHVNNCPEDINKLIGIIQRRISDLKLKANLDFTQKIRENETNSPTQVLKIIPEGSLTNYFILDCLAADFDEAQISTKKNNFHFLTIICPHLQTVFFLTFDREIPLNYHHLNSIINERSSTLEKMFNSRIENFIEERDSYQIFNLKNLWEKVEINSEVKFNTLNANFSLEKFSLKKIILTNNSLEEVRDLFLKNDFHTNFMCTNNHKMLKNLLEAEMNYFSAMNQITQVSFNFN